MPTVAVPLGEISSTSRGGSRRAAPRRIRLRHPLKMVGRRIVTRLFGWWTAFTTRLVRQLGWYPSVKPYVGYGTEEYSRLVCRTVYAPKRAKPHTPMRGIHAMLEVPAAGEPVRLDIDGLPMRTVQVGTMEVYDRPDSVKRLTTDVAVSDSAGYLDLLAEARLKPGIHTVSCTVPRRPPVPAELFTIPADTKIGVISDVDDTIMVTQVPTVWKAAYNMMLLSPRKRASVPGMAVMYNDIRRMFPRAPFFYLSTSPWNVESSIRKFITDYGFPDGPLLLRDLDPRPKTFIPSGVQHKLEYAEQLMEDFPEMKFILIGDDGQKDPTTYAEIARRFPGRVLAIGIRQLSPHEAAGSLGALSGFAATQPVPVTEVPVFTGTTGSNMRKTMLPYLKQFAPKGE
ncbi:MAG: phosphatase domain-containing protein [Bifidobacterium sp.]|nr:phosphatase domain-containing protein [Bifidobacterium sp.]